jgi:hypothetical protein
MGADLIHVAAEHGSEPLDYVTGREFDHPGDYQLLNHDFALRNTKKKKSTAYHTI